MMNNQISVDVLITYYNQEDCVDKSLETVFSQNVDFPVKVIIGDDGSSDNTVLKIKKWQDKYPNQIEYIIMDRDPNEKYEAIERVSKLRLELLKRAHSKYIVFLDGDDYFIDNDKFRKQSEILEKHKECVCCCHNYNYCDSKTGETSPAMNLSAEENNTNKYYWLRNSCQFSTFMFKNVFCEDRSLYSRLDNILFDDNIISLFFIQFGGVYMIPDIMFNYMQFENSSWNRRSDVERHVINAYDYYEESKVAPKMKFYSLLRHAHNYVYLYKHRKEIKNYDIRYWKNRVMNEKGLLYNVIFFDEISLIDKVKTTLLCRTLPFIRIGFVVLHIILNKLF